jgi:hypothetical protein
MRNTRYELLNLRETEDINFNMSTIEPWESPVSDIAAINKELLKFYFDQTEKCLKSSIDLSDRISTRCYALLAILLPAISIVIGYLVKIVILKEDSVPAMHGFLCTALMPLLAGLSLLISAVFPKEYTYLGSSPRNKMVERVFDNEDFKDENSYKLMLVYEIEEYQGRIDYVDSQNKTRVGRIQLAFYIVLITLGIVVAGLIFR